MARIDLTLVNGWVKEEPSSEVVKQVLRQSVVESEARRVPMTSETKAVPRFLGDEPDVVAEGNAYNEADTTLDEVVLQARKFGLIYAISEEDINDTVVDVLNTFKSDWASKFAAKFDNACLAVSAIANGSTKPFNSVYYEVSQAADVATRLTQTAGDVTFEDVSNALGVVESGDYYDAANTIVVAHPSLRASLRNLKDSGGVRVVDTPLDGTPESMFGYPIRWSVGAKTNATASAAPSGNPLFIIGNRQHLLNGVRSGPESMVSTDAAFESDVAKLKVRARRAFAVARAEAFAIVEKTAGG